MTTNTFTVLQVAPIAYADGGRTPTRQEENAVIGEAFRGLGDHTTSLADLQRALDDGAEVYLVRVAVNGKPVMQVRLVR